MSAVLGYIRGYSKTANVGSFEKQADGLVQKSVDVLKKPVGAASDYLIPLILLAPLAAGGAAGAIHSAIESPGDVNAEAAQKDIEVQELSEAVEELKRRKQHALLMQKLDARRAQERTLRV